MSGVYALRVAYIIGSLGSARITGDTPVWVPPPGELGVSVAQENQPRAPQPGDRPQTLAVYAGILLVAIALLAVLVASIVTTRSNENRRGRVSDDLAPFAMRLDQFELDAFRLAVEARAYARSSDDAARQQYETTLMRLQAERDELLRLAPNAGRSEQANEIAAAVDLAIEPPADAVAATDRGEPLEARLQRLDQGVAGLQTVAILGERLTQDVQRDIDALDVGIRDAEERGLLILILAVVTGGIACVMIFWLANRNGALARRVAADRRRIDDLIASVPGVVWEAWGQPDRANQRIDFVSKYIEEMLGYTTEEWLTTPNFWLSLVHPEDKESAAAEATAIFVSGERGESQFRWMTKDGRALDVLAYSQVVCDSLGQPAGMRGITFDVSDRAHAERQLRFASQASAVLFASFDPQETLAAVAHLAVPYIADWCTFHLVGEDGGPSLAALAHRDPDKVTWALELQERYPPDPDAETGVFAVIRSGEPELVPDIPDELLVEAARDEEHLRILREVGMRSYVCAPMVARGRTLGAVTMVSAEAQRPYDPRDLAAIQDLAARAAIAVDNARLHNDVERERARFESMIASTSQAVYQVDASGRIVHLNPAGERQLGYTMEELAGRPIHAVVHPTHNEDADECPMLRIALGGRRQITVTDQFERKDGSRFDVEISSAPIVVGNRVTGAVAVFQDVTLRLRQDQMKDDFIGFASHELRSPLTTINGMAKWLEKTAARSPDRFTEDERDAIEALSQGADRMGGIIELFLDLTRIESDRFVIEPEECDYGRILRQEAEALAARSPRVQIEVDAPPVPTPGWCDGHRLRQVLVNLLDNAVKYGGDPPIVKATLEVGQTTATFRVRDNGAGIAVQDRARVFDRFFRGKEVKGKGLGIGLFVSKQIAERVGGTLTFNAGADGTEFLLRVPLDITADGSVQGLDIPTAAARAPRSPARPD